MNTPVCGGLGCLGGGEGAPQETLTFQMVHSGNIGPVVPNNNDYDLIW